MRNWIICLGLLMALASWTEAQHISGNSGKTYYDEKETQLKEVYSYKTVTTLNPRGGGEGMEKEKVKDGRYFKYYKSGQLEISGKYKDGKKHGKWKYYNQEGKVSKIETYKNGNLKKTNNDPEQPEEKVKDAEEMEENLED